MNMEVGFAVFVGKEATQDRIVDQYFFLAPHQFLSSIVLATYGIEGCPSKDLFEGSLDVIVTAESTEITLEYFAIGHTLRLIYLGIALVLGFDYVVLNFHR